MRTAEFELLAADLRAAGRIEAANAAGRIEAVVETMRGTHPAHCAQPGLCWNGWRFSRVREELKSMTMGETAALALARGGEIPKRVSKQDAALIILAICELEEDERMGGDHETI
jgi:hypothetical protein